MLCLCFHLSIPLTLVCLDLVIGRHSDLFLRGEDGWSLHCNYYLCWIFKLQRCLSMIMCHMTLWIIHTWYIRRQQSSTPWYMTLWPWGLNLRGEILLDPIPAPISIPSTLSPCWITLPNFQAPSHCSTVSNNQPLNMPTIIRCHFNHHCVLGSHHWCHQI